jgi:3',5'-cyclic AMP phosphodiesterase CpdA
MLIAQITDTHIKAGGRLAYRQVDSAAKLRACVAQLNALQTPPDLVLLTGDLVDLGRDEEYAVLRELLAPLRMPVYAIPGNHDDRAALRRAVAVEGYVEEHPLRLIGLDTTIPGQPGGELCAERLAWLAARLAEAPQRPTALFMHHPPFVTGLANMDRQNCANGEALGDLLEQHRQVRHVLCGHVHRPIHTHWRGVTTSIAPSPSHSCVLDFDPQASHDFVLEPPTCALHYWNAEAGLLISHLVFIGDFGGRFPFYDEQGRLID